MTEADRPGPEGMYAKSGEHTYHLIERGTGDPVVFLHGGGPGCTGWTDFAPVVDRFAADHRVLLVDLLQYGRSDKPPIEGPMWDFHATSLVGLLDALGIAQADFVCNSWGGSAALCLGARFPARARTLTVTGSMPVFRGPTYPLPEGGRRGRNVREAYYGGEGPTWQKMRDLMARLEWHDGAAIPTETVDLRFRGSLDPEEIACGQSAHRRGEWQDLSGLLGQVAAPTLFCWGMQDAFLTPDYALMLATLVADGSLHVMERAGHHLQEERPRDFHLVVQAFLERHR